jgi:hypothetical protein
MAPVMVMPTATPLHPRQRKLRQQVQE